MRLMLVLYDRFSDCLQRLQFARDCFNSLLIYYHSIMPDLASTLRSGSATEKVVFRPLGTACEHFVGLSDYADVIFLPLAPILPCHSRKHVSRSDNYNK